jgi:hypothetical protein
LLKKSPSVTKRLPVPKTSASGQPPDRQPARGGAERAPERGRLARRIVVVEDAPRVAIHGVHGGANDQEQILGDVAPDPTDERGARHDERKAHAEREDRDERRGGDRDHCAVLERAAPDAHHGLEYDGEHGGLEPEEDGRNHGDVLEARVKHAEQQDREEAGQHEEDARREPAAPPMQHPAAVRDELLRLGTRQQHRIVHGV